MYIADCHHLEGTIEPYKPAFGVNNKDTVWMAIFVYPGNQRIILPHRPSCLEIFSIVSMFNVLMKVEKGASLLITPLIITRKLLKAPLH